MTPAVRPPVTGLTTAEAARRRAVHGDNALPAVAPLPLWRRVIRQFASPLIYILLFALAIDLASWVRDGASGTPIEAIAILAVLLLNAGIGAGQEYRSEQTLAQLRHLAAPRAWALRDGDLVQVPSAALVPGDVVRIEAGERIPADGTLAEVGGSDGRRVAAHRRVAADRQARWRSGHVRARSRCRAARSSRSRAPARPARWASSRPCSARSTPRRPRSSAGSTRSGGASRAGRSCSRSGSSAPASSPRAGPTSIEIVLFAVALAVAAVPEGMPAVVTLTLALGVQRMAKRNAVIRRLGAVEALGSVTVIATDKTGTLTENRMTVAAVEADDAALALVAMVLANDADPGDAAGGDAVGDPLEIGLLRHAAAQGVAIAALRRDRPRIAGRPFDSDGKFQRASPRHPDGDAELLQGRARGDPGPGRAIDDAARARWQARRGRPCPRGPPRARARARRGRGRGRPRPGSGWSCCGIRRGPRSPDAIRAAQDAGVRVVDDHRRSPRRPPPRSRPRSASPTPRRTGAELAAMTPTALQDAVGRTRVFARVAPEHKLALVRALQARGEIVAVTGDGVNDAPALKQADVGIAMGVRGSDVAREVADLVLLDDNFATIVAAIEEGRGIYANIQKFIRFMFSTNVALVLVIVVGVVGAVLLGLRDPAGGPLLPLTVAQMLWINFITDGPPALAIALDRNPHMLHAPPRPPGRALFDAASLRFVLISGASKALIAGALLVGLPHLGLSLGTTRTAVFLYLSIGQLVFAYPARRMSGPAAPNPALLLTVVLGSGLQLLTLLIAPLRHALGLEPIGVTAVGIVALAVALSWGAAELIARALDRPRDTPE